MGQGKRKKKVQSNVTDNESAKITTRKDTTQGMTCVTAAAEHHHLIVHAQVLGMAQEQATLIPVVITMIRLRLDFSAFPCFITGLKKNFSFRGTNPMQATL